MFGVGEFVCEWYCVECICDVVGDYYVFEWYVVGVYVFCEGDEVGMCIECVDVELFVELVEVDYDFVGDVYDVVVVV